MKLKRVFGFAMRRALAFVAACCASSSVEHEVELYAVLGVLRNASFGEIKRAYRASATRLHPDKLPT